MNAMAAWCAILAMLDNSQDYLRTFNGLICPVLNLRLQRRHQDIVEQAASGHNICPLVDAASKWTENNRRYIMNMNERVFAESDSRGDNIQSALALAELKVTGKIVQSPRVDIEELQFDLVRCQVGEPVGPEAHSEKDN